MQVTDRKVLAGTVARAPKERERLILASLLNRQRAALAKDLKEAKGLLQGAYVEPGLTVFTGRLDVAARVAWARAADTNAWSGGLSLTATTRVPSLRVQAGVEQRSVGSYLAILRLTASID